MKKGPLFVFISYFMWGLFPLYWKQLSALDSYYVIASRIVWSAVFCFLLLAACRLLPQMRAALCDRHTMLLVCLAGIAVTLNWGSYIVAVDLNRIIESSLAYYVNPLLAIVLGAAVFRERLSVVQWIASGLACVGVGISIAAYGEIPWLAILISGSFLAYTAIKKVVRLDGRVSTFLEILVVMPFALFFILRAESLGAGALGVLGGARLILVPLCGVVTSIPLLFFSEGMRTTDCSLAGVLMYINPTMQLLIGVFVYGEKFTEQNALMFAFVWAAVALFLTDSLLAARRAHLAAARNNA